MQAFNLLYNNIASDKAPGLEPYEISRFLTDAQNAVVVALYRGTLGAAFESNEEVTAYLDTLVRQCSGTKVVDETSKDETSKDNTSKDDTSKGDTSNDNTPKDDTSKAETSSFKLNTNSTIFKLNNTNGDILFRTWEGCTIAGPCGKDISVPVIPVTQDEYWRTVRDPFKSQNGRRVLRLSYATASSTETFSVVKYSELISDAEIKSYSVRYISRPSPIILDTLPTGLSIDGESKVMTCMLPESLHQTILAEAVKMAKAIWN